MNDPIPAKHPFVEEDIPKVEIGLESFWSIMTVMDLIMIQSSCFIIGKFHVELVRPRERVHNPPSSWLGVL